MNSYFSSFQSSTTWYSTLITPKWKQDVITYPIHLVLEIKDSKNKTRFWKGKSFTDQFGTVGKMSDWISRTVDFKIPYNIKSEDKCFLYFWLPEDEIVHVKSVVVYNIDVKE